MRQDNLFFAGLRVVPFLVLGACASVPPAELAGNNFSAVTPHEAQTRPDVVGMEVRWGGTIATINTTEKKETCFEVVGRPLDSEARPMDDDQTTGRFIACATGFYDPEIYHLKREITFTGTVQTPTFGKIGKYDYIFPHLAADTVYLWPKRQPVQDYPVGYYGMGMGYDPAMMGGYPWMYSPW